MPEEEKQEEPIHDEDIDRAFDELIGDNVPDALAVLWRGDWLDVARYHGRESVDLLFTSTPYPDQRGFKLSPDHYLVWLRERIAAWLPVMKQETGVVALNVRYKRRSDGRFDSRLYDIPRMFEGLGLYFIDEYIWDQLNAPPRGNMQRTDHPGFERVFVFGLSRHYYFDPQFGEYAESSISSTGSAKKRGRDVAGSMAGGHSKIDERGARLDNVIRVSSSGDQGATRTGRPRPRVWRIITNFLG